LRLKLLLPSLHVLHIRLRMVCMAVALIVAFMQWLSRLRAAGMVAAVKDTVCNRAMPVVRVLPAGSCLVV
jgi:hypothetical protein